MPNKQSGTRDFSMVVATVGNTPIGSGGLLLWNAMWIFVGLTRGVHCTKHVRVYVSAQEGY